MPENKDAILGLRKLCESAGVVDLERIFHSVFQGGEEGFFKEQADLALYLIQHSETPDLYKSTEEFATPGNMKSIGDLTFPFSKGEDFYSLVADFYVHRPFRGIAYDDVEELLERHSYHFDQEDGKLLVSDVGSLSGLMSNCL